MANKKISELDQAAALGANDEFAVVQGTETKKTTLADLAEGLKNNGAGDTSGTGSSTDNAIVRWDGITGTKIQDSGVILDDSNNLHLNADGANNTNSIIYDGSAFNTRIDLSSGNIDIVGGENSGSGKVSLKIPNGEFSVSQVGPNPALKYEAEGRTYIEAQSGRCVG